jgi:hypothetical protein
MNSVNPDTIGEPVTIAQPNRIKKITELPALTADLLQSNSCLVDNLFADLWKQMGMKALLNKAGLAILYHLGGLFSF